MSEPIVVICRGCGAEAQVRPPNLPPGGGAASFHDDPKCGWVVLDYLCGQCWERRLRTWSCTHCGGSGPIDGNFCSKCHRVRPDPLPYVPDWDAIGKEMAERRHEAEALASEWDKEYPGWRLGGGRTRDRL